MVFGLVTVNPTAPSVAPVAEIGVEGTAIALNLGVTVNGAAGDSNSLSSLVVSAIPVGAVLSDGHGNSFTATAGNRSEEHTSELQSRVDIVCRLLPEKKNGIAA